MSITNIAGRSLKNRTFKNISEWKLKLKELRLHIHNRMLIDDINDGKDSKKSETHKIVK